MNLTFLVRNAGQKDVGGVFDEEVIAENLLLLTGSVNSTDDLVVILLAPGGDLERKQ